MSRSKNKRGRGDSRPGRHDSLPSGRAEREEFTPHGTSGPRDRVGAGVAKHSKGRGKVARRKRPWGPQHKVRKATKVSRLKAEWPVVRFLGLLGVQIVAFYLLLPVFTQTGVYQGYLALIADVSGGVLRVIEDNVTVVDRSVSSPGFWMEISGGCGAVEAMGLLAAAVFALPVALRSKLLCVLVGVVVLMAVNLLRIVTLFCVGVHYPGAVDVLHFDAWPATVLVLVLFCWLIWAHRTVRRRESVAGVSA